MSFLLLWISCVVYATAICEHVAIWTDNYLTEPCYGCPPPWVNVTDISCNVTIICTQATKYGTFIGKGPTNISIYAANAVNALYFSFTVIEASLTVEYPKDVGDNYELPAHMINISLVLIDSAVSLYGPTVNLSLSSALPTHILQANVSHLQLINTSAITMGPFNVPDRITLSRRSILTTAFAINTKTLELWDSSSMTCKNLDTGLLTLSTESILSVSESLTAEAISLNNNSLLSVTNNINTGSVMVNASVLAKTITVKGDAWVHTKGSIISDQIIFNAGTQIKGSLEFTKLLFIPLQCSKFCLLQSENTTNNIADITEQAKLLSSLVLLDSTSILQGNSLIAKDISSFLLKSHSINILSYDFCNIDTILVESSVIVQESLNFTQIQHAEFSGGVTTSYINAQYSNLNFTNGLLVSGGNISCHVNLDALYLHVRDMPLSNNTSFELQKETVVSTNNSRSERQVFYAAHIYVGNRNVVSSFGDTQYLACTSLIGLIKDRVAVDEIGMTEKECMDYLLFKQGTMYVGKGYEVHALTVEASIMFNYGILDRISNQEFIEPIYSFANYCIHNLFYAGLYSHQYTISLVLTPYSTSINNASSGARPVIYIRTCKSEVIYSLNIQKKVHIKHAWKSSNSDGAPISVMSFLYVDTDSTFTGLLTVQNGKQLLSRATAIEGSLKITPRSVKQSEAGVLVANRLQTTASTTELLGYVFLSSNSFKEPTLYINSSFVTLGSLTLRGPLSTRRQLNCCGGSNTMFGGCSRGKPTPLVSSDLRNYMLNDTSRSQISGNPGDTCDGASGGRAGGSALITATVYLALLGSINADGESGAAFELDDRFYRIACGGSGAGGNIYIEAPKMKLGPNAFLSANGGNCSDNCQSNCISTGGSSPGKVLVNCSACNQSPILAIFTEPGVCGIYEARSIMEKCPPFFKVSNDLLDCILPTSSLLLILLIMGILTVLVILGSISIINYFSHKWARRKVPIEIDYLSLFNS